MSDQKSDNNKAEEELTTIIASRAPEKSVKKTKPKKEGRLNSWMDRIAGFIFKVIIFGIIAGGVGVGIILVVPSEFLPNAPKTVDSEERIHDLEKLVANNVTNLQDLSGTSETLRSELDTLKEIIATQPDQFASLQIDLDNLTSEQLEIRNNLATTLEDLEGRLEEFGSGLEILKTSNLNLKEELVSLSLMVPIQTVSTDENLSGSSRASTIENYQQSGLNSQILILEGRLQRISEKVQEIDMLARSLAGLDEEIKAIHARIPNLEEGLADLDEQNLNFINQIRNIQETTAQMDSQLTIFSTMIVEENSLRNLTLLGIQAAVEAGIPYAAIIGDNKTNKFDLPPIILELSEEGVATLGELQTEFEDLVTEALKAVDSGTENETIHRIITSLVQVRSLTPREGDDAVAILSRLEESLNKGNLASVVDLYKQLPQSVKETLEPWKIRVQNRLDLILAVETILSQPIAQVGQ